MAKLFVSNKNETPRMFKNDFLELFSKIHWTAPLILYIPLILYFIYKSFFLLKINILNGILLFLSGVLLWTFVEYILHRFVFHYEPKGRVAKRLHWMFHGVHHDYPQDAMRLVMPPAISLILAVIFYQIFKIIFGEIYVNIFFPGFVLGYLIYDITHYAIHHFAFRNKFLLSIKKHHMNHHYVEPNKGYGVSSPIWDYVFGTTFQKGKK